MKQLNHSWLRIFGPMSYLVHDQEGAVTSELVGLACDRYSITRAFAGTDAHTTTGLAEAHIRFTKLIALKLENDCKQNGINTTHRYHV